MTQMWEFRLPDGLSMYANLDWVYVPYLEELRAWVLKNWEVETVRGWASFDGGLDDKEIQDDMRGNNDNWRRFYAAADRFVKEGTKPKHPIGRILDIVSEHMDELD